MEPYRDSEQLNELLFFDTFSHETDQEINLDLVQFPNPIIISEIRIIPLGARVEADFPGGVRLGATNPSAFSIDFYVNDLRRPSLSSFSNIGRFEYKQNVNIKFLLSDHRPTDGLLIKGYFRTITLAIFGVVTDLKNIVVKESSPQVYDPVGHTLSFKVNVSESASPQSSVSTEPGRIKESFRTKDPGRIKESFRAKDLEPLLTKLASALAQRNITKVSAEPQSKISEWSKDRPILASRSADANQDRDTVSYQRKRPYLSPVQSPASSPSDTSLRLNNNNNNNNINFAISDIPASPCSSHSRSPKHKQSRSRSPLRKNPPDRYLSPHRRSPTSHHSITSSKASPHHEPYKWKRRRVSPPSSPVPSTVHKSVTSLSNENSYHNFDKNECQVKVIPPVNKDLLEEISPEHSIAASDWENISEDENLDEISSLDGNNGPASVPIDQDSEALESISSEEEYFEENNNDNFEEIDPSSRFCSIDQDSDPIWRFDPHKAEFSPSKSLHDPAQTAVQRHQSLLNLNSEEKSSELVSLLADRDSRNQKWIESIENIARGIEFLPIDNNQELLLEWLIDALDLNIASKQALIPSKIRQIKAGLKLTNALLTTNETVITKLLDVQLSKILMNLLEGRTIPMPIRLFILQTIDSLCNTVIGIEHILSAKFEINDSELGVSCYQYLLKTLMKKPSVRITFAIEALLNKIHLYILLKYFTTDVQNNCCSEKVMASCMKKIGENFASLNLKCTQKPRYLPVSCFFEQKTHKSESFLSFYNWSNHLNLIDSIISILSKPCLSSKLLEEVICLLQVLFSEESFSRFLLSSTNCSKANELFRILLNKRDLTPDQTKFGIYSSHLLQVYQLIDLLQFTISSQEFSPTKFCDDPSLCTILSKLYFLARTAIGQDCVTKVLTKPPFFEVILPFLTPTNVESDDEKLFKSVCAHYAAELCNLIIQSNNDNLYQFYTSYGQLLYKVAQQNQIPCMSSLTSWLSPLDDIKSHDYSEECFRELCLHLKNNADAALKLKDGEIFTPPPSVITVVRILRHLCLPTTTLLDCHSLLNSTELKYKYAILQIFSNDALSSLLTILQKTAETLLLPSHLSPSLVGSHGNYVISFIMPSIILVKSILKDLMIARGRDFCNVSPIPVMLKLFSVMYLFPSSSFSYPTSRCIIREIIEVLMLYTGLILTTNESDPEAFSKSIWSNMIKEILTYTFLLPMNFIHGLSLLSELLPLPLPLQSLTPLSDEEEGRLIDLRKLWSAHLLVLAPDIEKLISSFVLCSSAIVHQLLRRVCVQISDLSSPASTLVVRSVLEALLENLPANSANNSSLAYVLSLLSFLMSHPSFKMAFIHTMHIGGKLDEKYFEIAARLLKLLQPKATKSINRRLNMLILSFLHSLCDSSIFLDSKSKKSSLQILSNSLPPYDSIKIIISTLLKFIDSTLRSPESLQAPVLSPNSLQDHKFIEDDHIDSSSSTDYASLTSTLKVLHLFCGHDYSFLPLKQAVFEIAPFAINALVSQMCKLLDLSLQQDGLIKLIKALFEFLKAFALPVPHRCGKLSRSDLCSIFAWKVDEIHTTTPSTSIDRDDKDESNAAELTELKTENDDSPSPLLVLHDSLQQKIGESTEIQQLLETTKSLIKILETTKDDSDSLSLGEINLPLIEPLPLQFSNRNVYGVTSEIDQEKLELDYWLSMPTFYAHERYLNLADSDRINFIELCSKYISEEYDLRKDLQKILKTEQDQKVILTSVDAPLTTVKVDPILTTKESKPILNVKKSFLSPLRGRGYSRTGNLIHSSRANDPFRSRPPNTSRPPSMHVDDFVALEQSTNHLNNYEPSNKRYKSDYIPKQRTGSVHSSFTRSFNSSNKTASRLSSPSSSHHSDMHSLNSIHTHHHSPVRNNIVNTSSRNSLPRYSRDTFSPSLSRSSASTSSQQLRAKPNVLHNRHEARDPRLNRDLLRE